MPGQNFIDARLNRAIVQQGLDMLLLSGLDHGGAAVVSNVYLEGTWSEVYPDVGCNTAGLQKLFKPFSFPGGISSPVAPSTPGSIREGGELGYPLSHAYGAVLDNPDLIVACVVGDAEAETGPWAAAWHTGKLLDPVGDGAVLPILHLNGYKISNPTLLARIPQAELEQFFRGCCWKPLFVDGDDPMPMHQLMAQAVDSALQQIQNIQQTARAQTAAGKSSDADAAHPRWPLIVLRAPKGWTGPKLVDGVANEATFRSHQIPLSISIDHPEHVQQLQAWLQSYGPEELFDAERQLLPERAALAPLGTRRMGANPHANGGLLLRDLQLPDFRSHAVAVAAPDAVPGQAMRVLGSYLRDVIVHNATARNFRIFGPDETLSNQLGAVFEATNRQWNVQTLPGDKFLATSGRVLDSMLSEHHCHGALEG